MSGFIGDNMKSIIGDGIPGMQSKGGLIGNGRGTGMVGSSARGRNRKVLRRAFGNSKLGEMFSSPTCYASANCPNMKTPRLNRITPFRAAMTAGDIAGTVNQEASPHLPGSNQVSKQVPFRLNFGGVHNNGGALFTGNPRYVYDGADYVRFKKLQAINRNYNDKSFGGDQSNATQSVIRAVRHS